MTHQQQLTINIKITFAGSTNVGKTSLIVKQVDDQFLGKDQWKAMIGYDFRWKIYPFENYQCKAAIWDLSGSQRFKLGSQSYYRKSDAVLICFALDGKSSFQNCYCIIDRLKKIDIENCTFYLIGCKSDLEPKIQYHKIEELCQKYDIKYLQTSSKQNYGVHEMFSIVISEAFSKKGPQLLARNKVKLMQNEPVKRFYCF